MTSNNDLDSRTLSIKRTLDAPLGLVWEAWTDPSHIARWWAPKRMELQVIKHDFKEGGAWEYHMTMPNGNLFVAEGRYTQIIPKERIYSTADFKPMTEGVEIQAIFEAKGEQTLFTFNVVHPSAEYCQQQEKMGFMNGWGTVFNQLEEHLKSLPA